jgi:cytochrome oxidase assembly protein ShyY1
LPITVSLSLWQVDRAEEKRSLLDSHHQRKIAQPVTLEDISEFEDRDYLRVIMTGEYDNRSPLLLDNKVRHGLPGYEVISPFRTNTGQWILVNRGWTKGSRDRSILPKIDKITGEVRLTGYLYRSPGKQLMLGNDSWQLKPGPIVIQNPAPEKIANKLDLAFYDYSLRLDAEMPGALETGWVLVSIQPGKHIGYAVQWAALTILLIILTLFANSNLGGVIRARKLRHRHHR